MRTLITAALVAVAMMTSAACIEEAHASPHVGLELARETPASFGYNTGGNSVFNQLKISDATGVTTTVAAAGTPVAVTHATLVVAQSEDGSACITDTPTSGLFTIAVCGAGKVRLTACINDAIGENNATWTAGIYRTRSATVTASSPLIRETEGATAARDSEGCVDVVVSASSADTYDVRVDSGTNADTVVIRQMTFTAEKLSSI